MIGIIFADRNQAQVVEDTQIIERLLPVGPVNFLFRQGNQFIEVTFVTILEKGVQEHRAERRCERQRDAGRQFIRLPAFEDLEQWDISLGDGFEEPILFEESLVFRMPDERKVGVKNERNETFDPEGGRQPRRYRRFAG